MTLKNRLLSLVTLALIYPASIHCSNPSDRVGITNVQSESQRTARENHRAQSDTNNAQKIGKNLRSIKLENARKKDAALPASQKKISVETIDLTQDDDPSESPTTAQARRIDRQLRLYTERQGGMAPIIRRINASRIGFAPALPARRSASAPSSRNLMPAAAIATAPSLAAAAAASAPAAVSAAPAGTPASASSSSSASSSAERGESKRAAEVPDSSPCHFPRTLQQADASGLVSREHMKYLSAKNRIALVETNLLLRGTPFFNCESQTISPTHPAVCDVHRETIITRQAFFSHVADRHGKYCCKFCFRHFDNAKEFVKNHIKNES